MPQELHVLRCADCGTFQVHIVKKVPKWTCKICQKKQSVLQVFARGSGKDCRLHVQRLNEQRLQQDTLLTAAIANKDDLDADDEPLPESEGDAFNIENTGSKWDKYVDEKEESAEEEHDSDIGFEDMGFARKRKREHRAAISMAAKKPARFRTQAKDEDVDDLPERPPKVERPEDTIGEQRSKQTSSKQTRGAKGTEAASKWAKYVDPAEGDDSGAEETLVEAGDSGEFEEDLDELLKF